MSSPSLPEILAQLRAALAEVCPGHIPKRLIVKMTDGEKVELPFGLAVAMPAPAAPPPPVRPLAPARHSPDFRSVHWYGVDYSGEGSGFSPTQAACVKVLWEAWENGTPDMGQDAILEDPGSDCNRLRDLFRNHPAWGTLIVATGSSNARTFRLNEP